MTSTENGGVIPVLLLKTKSTPHDGYEEYFNAPENGRFRPHFLPVLEHRFQEQALHKITDLLLNDGFFSDRSASGSHKYGGIIFTSQRAVEAFSHVVQSVRKSKGPDGLNLSAEMPLYVVGPATARGLKALEVPCPIFGEESGNGEALAGFILEHYNNWTAENRKLQTRKLPLLFLVGEQRRDIIPKKLQADLLSPERQIGVDELVVYETTEMRSFRSNFAALHASNVERGASTQWIVVFSPTGCKAMLESLGTIDAKSGRVREDALRATGSYISTIGPTTREYLRREFSYEPDVCSPIPSPEGIGAAIKEFMGKLSG